LCSESLYKVRHGLWRCYLTKSLSPDELFHALERPGEFLKTSRKAQVRRVGDWLVKESRGRLGLDPLKHTLRRERYRRAWRASWRLYEAGIGVPRPIAFIEKGFGPLISGNIMVSEYLEAQRDVEAFLRALAQRGAGQDTLIFFLAQLAEAVNRLNAAGVYHADLSGKNIFTEDGRSFTFIDLDAIQLDVAYDDKRRLLNLVQLYDSFCDQLSDVLLVPFIEKMLGNGHDPRVWMPRIRKGQEMRRLRTEALRERRARKA
ncbi:MAG: hypothetical protein IH629_03305, partial [Thermoleophilia bacterium]|nr:hypothetical protein [Thermoleophilia bacterium]